MSSSNEILAGLAEIIAEVSGKPTSAVTPEAEFRADLDLDSLSMVEVVVAAEERFGIRIPDVDVEQLTKVGDAVDYITGLATVGA